MERIMKKLAKKGGFIWFFLTIMPNASIAYMICEDMKLSPTITMAIILPLLALQLFALFIAIRYQKEF
jgi:hypothetical protein